MDVKIDVGFDFTTFQRLRLLGVNTPERNKPGFMEATLFVSDLCLNREIRIITYKKDSFGRWLSVVFVDGQNLNALLLEKGFAVPYT